MTILEDLKSGRLVVVPREALARALRIVSEMERQNKVNDSYASNLPKSERNTSELWMICNGHIKDRTSELRRALPQETRHDGR